MNLLDTLGLSPLGALLVAGAGIGAAIALALTRLRRVPARRGLGLQDR
jgi:hypothetical protein